MSTIATLAAEYGEVKARRQALEKQAAELKTGREEELKQAILAELSASGIKSANMPGVGRVICREADHYEIQNIEMLAVQMFSKMLEAAKAGRPMSDGLLLQRRVHKENLESYISGYDGATEEEKEQRAAEFGVRHVVKTDLTFTKDRSEKP